MSKLGARLKNARRARGYTQEEIAQKLGVSIGTVSGYERDYREPDNDTLKALAKLYGVSVEYLITGASNQIARGIEGVGQFVNIPIVAEIPCGEPVFTSDSILGYMPMDKSILPNLSENDYVWLRAKGNSMTQSNIHDGSLVLIRLQPEVDSGEIAAVCVDDEDATIKRVIFAGSAIVLQPSNPIFPTHEYARRQVRIVGKVIKILSDPI